MDKERPKFLEGASKNSVDSKKAEEVWDLLDKFANYGFNKSHAAAYAVVSYQTAWLKANYPVEFMASVMNCDLHLTDKLHVYFDEVKRLEIQIIPPCINRSESLFSVNNGMIAYALGGLKNVGSEAMRLFTDARKNGGLFLDLIDIARRVDLKRVGKRPLEMLVRAGAFDQLDNNRKKVFESLDALVGYSSATHEEMNSSQGGLFGDSGEDLPAPRLPMPEDWLPVERLSEEHKAIGFYLSGHPLDDYMGALKRKNILTLEELEQKAQGGKIIAKIAGSVSGKQVRKSAKGNRFAFAQLTDPTGAFEVTIFSDVLEKFADCFDVGQNVTLTVEANIDADQLKLLVRSAQPVDISVQDAAAMGLKIFVSSEEAVESIATRLNEISKDAPKRALGPVHLILSHPELPGEVEIALKNSYPVNTQIKGAIKHIDGVLEVLEF